MADSTELLCPVDAPFVELEEEPAHKIIFENEFIRSYYAQLPPGHVTLLHRHKENTYTIFLVDASICEQIPGNSWSNPRHVAAFAGFCKHFKSSPVVHRIQAVADNKVEAPILAVEIRRSPNANQLSATSASKVPLDKVPGYVSTEEGAWDQIRVYKLTLGPGDSCGPHDFDFYGVVLCLTDGYLNVTEIAGTSPFPKEGTKKGTLHWFEPKVTHDLRNATYRPFHAIVLEIL